MIHKFYKEQQGGIVLEASFVLPFFLAFVVGLVVCIQIAVLELALQAGVSEATKSIAGQLYPVQLLVQEAKSKLAQSRPVEMLTGVIERVQSARTQVTNAENLADEYAAYIPEPLLELIRWEKEKRELSEDKGAEALDEFYDVHIKSRMQTVFTPIVYAFCDERTVPKDTFKVTSITLPSMENGRNAILSIEAQITYKLPLPFISQRIILKKRAYERAWVGA
ncbi:pilus assembly protein [Paenibacillus alba]|uniref:pilus assembly protein n=1 Tax=Paenibacillus alba TaxID=1197127 RepID=UPI00156574E4|nr:pilus assembly protein [Paenibacillus alba]NQX64669.1 pilus assembly protein [Paenibacillus alba]